LGGSNSNLSPAVLLPLITFRSVFVAHREDVSNDRPVGTIAVPQIARELAAASHPVLENIEKKFIVRRCVSEIAPETNLKSRPRLVQDDTVARIDPPR
jgi:hypothetical protein